MSRLIFKMRNAGYDAVELTIGRSVVLMDRDNMEALGEWVLRYAIETRGLEDSDAVYRRFESLK